MDGTERTTLKETIRLWITILLSLTFHNVVTKLCTYLTFQYLNFGRLKFSSSKQCRKKTGGYFLLHNTRHTLSQLPFKYKNNACNILYLHSRYWTGTSLHTSLKWSIVLVQYFLTYSPKEPLLWARSV